jgi:PBSX family phage terminase large subunit
MSGYVFGKKHREYMARAYRSVISVAEGAVRAGKTVDNVFVFASLLERSPDKLHLATGSTIGNAKLNIGDCNGLGLEHIFAGRCKSTKYRGNEALSVMTEVGERIVIYAGGKNADSYKRIRGNSYGMWIATEINLHADAMIKEAFNRQLAAVDRRVFWDLNPTTPTASIYRDYLDKFDEASRSGESRDDYYNYAHFTIFDNPVVTPERLSDIIAQYDKTSVWYRRDILGERCAAEGLVYRRFADAPADFLCDTVDMANVDFVTLGVDFGGNRSRTTFVATAIMRDGGIVILDEHVVAGEKGEIDSTKVERELFEFIRDLRARHEGIYVKYVFADSEAQYLINGIRRYLASRGERAVVMDSAKRPIADRIALVNRLIATDKFRVMRHCAALVAGLSEAVWDERAECDRRLDNFTSDIDILDAMEYSIERYMGKIN